jgi:hypothetical protein
MKETEKIQMFKRIATLLAVLTRNARACPG